ARARSRRRRRNDRHRLLAHAGREACVDRLRVRRRELLRVRAPLVALGRWRRRGDRQRPPERLHAELRRRPLPRLSARGQAVPARGVRRGAARVLASRVAVHRGEAARRSAQRLGDAALRLPEAAPVSAVAVARDGDVLRITLTRPERRNAFDAALIDELSKAFVDVGRARAVVLAGEGPSFCAGADVDWMRSSVGLSFDENVADANAMRRMFEAIDSCPAPVVARVHGHALGGGAGLVAAADIAVAATGTQFAFSEVKLGIIPAVISPFALAKIGEGNARRYFVTGERFDAAAALRIGLVSEV